jgi:hypothetical protein
MQWMVHLQFDIQGKLWMLITKTVALTSACPARINSKVELKAGVIQIPEAKKRM